MTDNQDSKTPKHDAEAAASLSSASIERGTQKRAQNAECAFDSTEDPRYYKPIPSYEESRARG